MRFTLVLASLLAAAPLHGQGYVGGFVLDSATNTPLPCLQVSLVDTTGRVVARQLTTGEGQFQLDAPATAQNLRENRVQGEVVVHFVVDSTGRVIPPTVQIARTTHHGFTDAVRSFLRSVEYEPARLDHRPACALMRDWPFTFSLR
jgi:TonB family protein